jgi:probable rRNA maturation factor
VRVSAAVRSALRVPEVVGLASAVLAGERSALAALSISLVSPARIRGLNRAWLGRDEVTDVLAFDLGGVGDVYVCPQVAARNAAAFDTTAREELARLVVHGVLHVIGYQHSEGPNRTRGEMWRRQERYLARFRRRR